MSKAKRGFLVSIAACLWGLLLTGCANSYMVNRGHDAADIFTATVGTGGGIALRVGPFHWGMAYMKDKAGLRGGEWSSSLKAALLDSPLPIIEPPMCCYVEAYTPSVQSLGRRKGYGAFSRLPLVTVLPPHVSEKEPSDSVYFPYYSDIRVALGIAGCVGLGVNPGEFLDFLLGWTTLDIYGDDIASVPEQNENLQLTVPKAVTTDKSEANVEETTALQDEVH